MDTAQVSVKQGIPGVRGRLIKAITAQGFGQIVNISLQVATVPLFLHFWGKVLYGEWLLLSTVLGYFALSDLSFGTVTANELAMRTARGDRDGALTVFQTSSLLISTIALTILMISLLVVPWLPLNEWLRLTIVNRSEAQMVVSLFIAQVIVAQYGGIMVAWYRCEGNYARGLMATNLQRIADFIATVVVLTLHCSLSGLALAILCTRITGILIVWWDAHHCTPWLHFGSKYARWDAVRPLVSPALAFNAFPLGYAMSLQGIVTIVGLNLGPAAVTLFSTSRTLTRTLLQLINTLANMIWAELSMALGANNLALARTLHRRACQLALWGALIAAIFLFFFGQPLYHLWTQKRVSFDNNLFRLLLLVVICSSFWSTSYVVPMAINRHQRLALVFVCANAISLTLAVALTHLFGIYGAALAILFGEAVMIAYVLPNSMKLLEEEPADFFRAILTPPFGWILQWLRKR